MASHTAKEPWRPLAWGIGAVQLGLLAKLMAILLGFGIGLALRREEIGDRFEHLIALGLIVRGVFDALAYVLNLTGCVLCLSAPARLRVTAVVLGALVLDVLALGSFAAGFFITWPTFLAGETSPLGHDDFAEPALMLVLCIAVFTQLMASVLFVIVPYRIGRHFEKEQLKRDAIWVMLLDLALVALAGVGVIGWWAELDEPWLPVGFPAAAAAGAGGFCVEVSGRAGWCAVARVAMLEQGGGGARAAPDADGRSAAAEAALITVRDRATVGNLVPKLPFGNAGLRNSVAQAPHGASRGFAKQSFAVSGSQTEFGNQGNQGPGDQGCVSHNRAQ